VHFGHFWSLAVEEQFYLVWPLVVYAFGRVALLRISVLCFAGALALRFAVPLWLDPLANYVLMPTRMDAFAAGAAVALLMRAPGGLRRLGAWPKIVLFVALAILAALYQWKKGLKVHEPLVHTYGFSLIALAVAALIAVALTAREGSWLRRALSCAALTTLGKYSYALYVFHQPVLAILRDHGLGSGMLPRLWGSQLPGLLAFGAIGFALSMLCALLSWRLIEAPFLRLKRRLPTAGGALPTAGGALPTSA
jgi:peptidoglycan/LPS O-acetylase OafA/YrhL